MSIVIPERNALVLNLRDPERVKAVIPYFEEIDFEGRSFLAVPHTHDTMRVLRNLGIDINGQEVMRYKYTPPLIRGRYAAMHHQLETAVFLSNHARAFCLHPPRMGKTASALMALDFLRQQRAIRSAMIVSPVSGMHSVWEAETFGLFPHWSVAVLEGGRQTRLKLLDDDYDLFIINPDGLKVITQALSTAVKRGRIGAVVLDESTFYGNNQSDRWAAANEVTKRAPYVWAMTGTPGGPMEVYGQVRLINPVNVPDSMTAWRNMTMYPIAHERRRWFKPATHAKALIERAMQPAIRTEKRDAFDLPPLQRLDYDAPLSAEQHKAYELIRKHSIMQAKSGEIITAVNAAAQMLKLVQVACGGVRTDDGSIVQLAMPDRLAVLDGIIADAEYKVVIFAPFKAAMTALVDHLSKRYTVARIDGDVTGKKRDQIFAHFQARPDPHILVAHPATVSFSVELSAADTIVFFGPPLNGPFVYEQAVERINSMHQKSETPAIIHLSSTPAERRLFRSLKEGVDFNKGIVEMFSQVISDTNLIY
jgi:SNF2 family DNA or RNA helicase